MAGGDSSALSLLIKIFIIYIYSVKRVNMTNPILNGPQAPENNPPIEPEFFKPSAFPIVALSRGRNTLVTLGTAFGVHNNYVVGQLVKLLIPSYYGARQLDQKQGYVIAIPTTDQVLVDIDSSIGVNAFIPNPPFGPTPPQIIALGDVNTGVLNTGRTRNGVTIPGSFQNISPAQG